MSGLGEILEPGTVRNALLYLTFPRTFLPIVNQRHQSFEVGPGGLRVAAFVGDMARVFEDFVATALTEAWAPLPGHTRTQYLRGWTRPVMC